jgi:Domain of unknown function (DUF4372)/Transposase DDE domain
MNYGKTIFAQLMDFLPAHEFRQCVERYQGHYKIKSFTCWDQFLCMAFAQLTYRESLRDIQACLRGSQQKLYHMGFRGKVSRNTLAHANQVRDWRIYADFAHILIVQARRLYAHEDFGVELEEAVYAFDASTIDLCLSVFPGAKFRQRKGAIKLHTLMDLRGSIPTLIFITHGKVHEINLLDELLFEPGAIYLFDRGYLDFARLYKIHQSPAFFIIRAKRNFRFRRLLSQPADKAKGIQADQIIQLHGFYSHRDYPDRLRRIRYFDAEKQKRLVFLTNNFTLPALTIAELFRCRWKIELFFKWIKQHLRIKAFYGISENAVKTQIWIAITIYVLVAIIKKKLKLEPSLYSMLQILSVTLFEKTPLFHMLSQTKPDQMETDFSKQLKLFS